MKTRLLVMASTAALAMALGACSTPLSAATATPLPPPPSPTSIPPTTTPAPPTSTPEPAIIIDSTALAADNCPMVTLNTAGWAPLAAMYNGGSDPFFQIHDNESGFYFNIELYTVYGPGWTGQTGEFATDCSRNGICVYLVPDDKNPYLASKTGVISITVLAQTNGQLQKPVDLLLKNLTLKPVPGSSSTGCYHVDEVVIQIPE